MNTRLLEQVLKASSSEKFSKYFDEHNSLVLTYLADSNWNKAFAVCVNEDERQTLVCWFLCISPYTNEYYKKFILNSTSRAIEIITRIFSELGFEPKDNPYIQFMSIIVYRLQKELSRDDWVLLNDLYANYVLDSEDINGTGPDGEKHLIFDKYLYEHPKAYEVVKIYSKLSEYSNVHSFNLDNMSYRIFQGNEPEWFKKIKDEGITNKNYKQLRDFIIYVYFNSTNYELSSIRALDVIQNTYNVCITSTGQDISSSHSSVNRIQRDIRDLNKNNRLQVISDLLKGGYITKDELTNIIN